MKFVIVTHALHYHEKGAYYAYAPYVNEMNLWGKYVDKLLIVAPATTHRDSHIENAYQHKDIVWYRIPTFSLLSPRQVLRSLVVMPVVFVRIFMVLAKADHIHLRCPGNVGLLGCVAQMFFPGKPKTAKYAGNWDAHAKQPWSYRFQKWMLRNTFLTRNMQVLVYGHWPSQTKNIKPFFTATYFEKEKEPVFERNYKTSLEFLFVGTLSPGKQPLWCIQFVEKLNEMGLRATLDVYGEGVKKEALVRYTAGKKGLNNRIKFHGNQSKEVIKKRLQQAHFLILPSKSEGWPKVIAEAMFWGCIPMGTPVSCISWMLDDGVRGIIITEGPNEQAKKFAALLDNDVLKTMSRLGMEWSRNYTLDAFETEIEKLLKH